MKLISKFFILLFLVLNFNQSTNAKPLPPGSGEGDVPANILILLDSSKSMVKSRIGESIPILDSMTIDGNGNRVLASTDRNDNGLYLFNSSGERINFTGTNQSGESYTINRWRRNVNTDTRCDWRIGSGVKDDDYFLPLVSSKFRDVHYQAGVTVSGTNINNENLIFVNQWDSSTSSAIFALDDQYNYYEQ